MSKITVCIPAYRSHDFIAKTLSSVQDQTFSDFDVRVAIEPTDDHQLTLDSIKPFLADARFKAAVNQSVLGWAENVGSLLTQVDSPLFVVLPHDDSWSADYLERLHAAIELNSDACVAYSDIQQFGAKAGVTTFNVDNSSVFNRLLTFYYASAEGFIWRGLTRSSVLERTPFPTNDYAGFAVECIWSSVLLTRGEALRVPGPRYFKRIYPPNSRNVSGKWRRGTSDDWILNALKVHRKQLMLVLKKAALGEEERLIAEVACEAAALKRSIELLSDRPRLIKLYLKPLETIIDRSSNLPSPYDAKVLSMLFYSQAKAYKTLARFVEAEAACRSCIEFETENWEAHVLLSLLLRKRGETELAQESARQAAEFAPYASEVAAVLSMSARA